MKKDKVESLMMPTKDELLHDLRSSNAVLSGHFLLSSGLHSDLYIQCALLLKNPQLAQKFAEAIVSLIPEEILKNTDVILSPAMGAIIIGHEVARLSGKEFIFLERVNGKFSLRRGFQLDRGTRVIVVEDVVTTAGSSLEVIDLALALGCEVRMLLSIIDRSNGLAKQKVGNICICKFSSLIELQASTFTKDNIPDNLRHLPAIKPGSR